ncbi:MAG TPA: DUF1549 and DUF1553 domain-containing protein [Tepidisphaeraceae bacterium]|nr:DUF1549 and DUF1553 domain-containing protein [Tepidisphaeraceae bacterium]
MRFLTKTLPFASLIAFGFFAVPSDTRGEPTSPGATQDLRAVSQRFGDLSKAEDPSFRRHVVPLLARAGCSSRECHGSFQGRGGFQLSLFGSEWDHDFVQLTQSKGDEDELHVDAKDPTQSLILLKPTMQVKHKGKERFKKDSWQYNVLLKWIQEGAKNDAEKTGDLQNLEISPSEIVFKQLGQSTPLKVLAHWTDGRVEDVTELTRFKTNDETVANVSDSGVVSSTGKGDSHIVASYDNGVVPIPVMLPVSQFAGASFPAVSARTKVDELVLNKLRKVGVVPSEVCTDAEFLRRVTLDVTGTLPPPDEVLKFTNDPNPNKRSAKIDELLKTPTYTAWWTTKFCDYTGDSPRELNVGGNFNKNPGEMARQWYDWLYKRIAENRPYDEIVADIVLATSRTSPDQSYKDYTIEMDSYFRSNNAADYADHPTLPYFWQRRNVQLPQEKALAFSHAFLGVRLECAQCHKHPFDRWTKQDFAQFTAFFTPIVGNGSKSAGGKAAKDKGEVTYQTLTKEITEKVTKEVLGDDAAKMDPQELRKVNAKKYNDIRKMEQQEVTRRIDAGEPVPWPELWVNSSAGNRIASKKKGTVDLNVKPKILGGATVSLTEYPDPRKPLMDWLRSGSNPYFAKAFVNRVWASYFNRGIVDPPDDMNLANAPCNAELLNYLAQGFVSHNYDMKWLHREILNSDTYQRSWKTNPTNLLDNRNFSHEVVRQLPAEVMLDAIDQSIAADSKLSEFQTDIETRAIGPVGTALYVGKGGKGGKGSAAANDGYFLTLFGKPTRETNCDCERTEDPTLLQTLFTRNDPNLLTRIEGNGRPDSSWISQLRKAKADQLDTDKLITDVFLRTVSRVPTQQERTQAQSDVAAAKTKVDGVRDLLWAMINTREFKVNH